ncbi:MAG: PEGA domain-containing protein [Vicinamibacteraceae bacterium]
MARRRRPGEGNALNHDLTSSSGGANPAGGQSFGPFPVLHQIGMGAQGPVFRAQDTVAGQIVAIKAFKLDVSPELAPSIADALRALVGHAPSVEGLVPLFDAGLEGDTPWLAMEHLSCQTLDTRLREGGLLPLEEAMALVRALADAVDTAHAHGLDHGSLHPRDVFLPEDGGVIVSGFGVAAAVGVAGLRPPRRRPFTAPETLTQKPLDAPADRYALGVMAYEIVSGRRLLGAGDDLGAGLSARAETSDIPRAATALAAMLAERPDHRPSSATAFAQALCAALESPPSAAETIAMTAVMQPAAGRPSRPAGEPPTPEALAEFARQGTFWEPPRRDVEDPDAATMLAGDAGAGPLSSSTAPAAPPMHAFDDTVADSASIPVGAGLMDLEPEPELAPASTASLALDPQLRVETAGRDGDSLLFRTLGDAGDGPGGPAPTPEAGAHTPPLVVLALTLGLGLAIGAAGGYLVGHRSGERAAQRVLGGETGTTSAPFDAQAPPPAAADPAPPPSEARRDTPRPPPSEPAPRDPASRDPASPGSAAARPAPAGAAAAPTRGRPAPVAPATGQLAIRSTPNRAGVLIDGSWRGRTPLTVPGLSIGTHAVRVVEDGYVAETRRVTVDARSAGTTVSFQLARVRGPERPAAAARPGATTGALRVESRPSGAAVFVDGRVVGATPLLVSDLAPGAHQVRLELLGHRPWSTTATIVAGQSVRVAASLEESN